MESRIIFFPLFLCLVLSIVVVLVNANNYRQSDCKLNTFQSHFIENYQSTTSEKSSLEIENLKCLRHYFFKTEEKNTSVANEDENISPLQNYSKVELVKDVSEFGFGRVISENDFSRQKSYIRFGGVEGVGKVARVAAETGVETVQYTKSRLQLGREMHTGYRLVEHAPELGRFKEFTGIKGIRPDFVDFGTKTIYELNPSIQEQCNRDKGSLICIWKNYNLLQYLKQTQD